MTNVRVPLLPPWLRWSAVVGVAGVLFYASVLTVPPEDPVVVAPPGPDDLIPLDKWRHFVGYAGFGGALAYATTDWDWPARRLALLVVGVTMVYGVGIEVWQYFVPVRYFSVADAYANALGGALVTPWFLVRSRLTFVSAREWVRGLVGGSAASTAE